jgi:hypothetical protein
MSIEYDEHGMVRLNSLKLYTLYRVVLYDCTVKGSFTSRLIAITKLDPTKLVFFNGVVLENWQGCTFEEIQG